MKRLILLLLCLILTAVIVATMTLAADDFALQPIRVTSNVPVKITISSGPTVNQPIYRTAQGEWKTLHTSPVMRGGQPALIVEIPLQRVKYLRLYTTSAGDGIGSDHALWGAARLTAGQ